MLESKQVEDHLPGLLAMMLGVNGELDVIFDSTPLLLTTMNALSTST